MCYNDTQQIAYIDANRSLSSYIHRMDVYGMLCVVCVWKIQTAPKRCYRHNYTHVFFRFRGKHFRAQTYVVVVAVNGKRKISPTARIIAAHRFLLLVQCIFSCVRILINIVFLVLTLRLFTLSLARLRLCVFWKMLRVTLIENSIYSISMDSEILWNGNGEVCCHFLTLELYERTQSMRS